MSKIYLNIAAPDFSLDTFDGTKVTLSSFSAKKNVLLVFNRGFT